MGMDLMRELVGDPYVGLYDCDGYPAMLAEQEGLLSELLDCQARGVDHPGMAPWSRIEDDIAETEAQIADLKAKVEAGILTPVQDLARSWEDAYIGHDDY